MNIESAKTAGQLAAAIDTVNGKLPIAEACANEKWPLVAMRFQAPAEGASYPGGTTFDALAFGPANAQDSADAIARVLAYLQAQLDALNAQLAAL